MKNIKKFRKVAKNLRIGFIYGSKSEEDAYYLNNMEFEKTSSGFMLENLRKICDNCQIIKAEDEGICKKIKDIDIAVVNMHGDYGEDGKIQGLLEYFDIPYTGPGIYTSSVGLNKLRYKRVIAKENILTPKYLELSFSCSNMKKLQKFRSPFLIKPIKGGSSIDISYVPDIKFYKKNLNKFKKQYRDKKVFAEEYIKGRMITIGVLDYFNRTIALTPVEIEVPPNTFYNQTIKLESQAKENKAKIIPKEHIPARISQKIIRKIRNTSLKIYQVIYANGFARFDFIYSQDRLYSLEVNTIPGMQRNSNFVESANASGISYEKILLALLYEAINRKNH